MYISRCDDDRCSVHVRYADRTIAFTLLLATATSRNCNSSSRRATSIISTASMCGDCSHLSVNVCRYQLHMTALATACQYNHVAAARWLLANNASMTLVDDARQTPLHYAAQTNNPHLVSLLLSSFVIIIRR